MDRLFGLCRVVCQETLDFGSESCAFVGCEEDAVLLLGDAAEIAWCEAEPAPAQGVVSGQNLLSEGVELGQPPGELPVD